jgi:ATP-dependent Zn protease
MSKKLLGWVIFIALAVMLFMLLNKKNAQYASVPISDVFRRLDSGGVRWITIDGDKLIGEFRVPQALGDQRQKMTRFQAAIPTGSGGEFNTMVYLVDHANGATVSVQNSPDLLINILVPLIPWVLIFGFIWFFVFRQLRHQRKPGEPLRVFLVNQPGDVPLATPVTPPAA